ncbi:MAG: hypothetical protein H7246_15360 [Phycisphaerae bacterium]|nr:hypothetical protein [Saprospiraceae bacterium]
MKHSKWMVLIALLTINACKKDEVRQIDASYNPEILASNFTNSTTITNQYFPIDLGKKYIYEGQTADGYERIETQRITKSKTILGIACVVVNDKAWVDGKLVEDTEDWYAQDNAGNVWYMGEYSTDFNPNGSVKDHDGSWEAGVDCAKPGINMLAEPKVGISYRQEYYFNNAEDEAEVVETGLTVTIPFGTFTNCVKIKEWTDLEPDQIGYKVYAPGIGMITDNNEVKLIEIQQ